MTAPISQLTIAIGQKERPIQVKIKA